MPLNDEHMSEVLTFLSKEVSFDPVSVIKFLVNRIVDNNLSEFQDLAALRQMILQDMKQELEDQKVAIEQAIVEIDNKLNLSGGN